MALLLPANVESILTSFSWLHIASASSYVVFHAYWPLVLAKLDLAVVRHIDLSFLFSFAFALCGLAVIVLDHRLAWGRSGVVLRLWC